MDRNNQLSPSHQAYLTKGGGSGWILLGLFGLALIYLLVTAGGIIGQAVVVALVAGSAIQLIRKWADRR